MIPRLHVMVMTLTPVDDAVVVLADIGLFVVGRMQTRIHCEQKGFEECREVLKCIDELLHYLISSWCYYYGSYIN